MVKKIKKEKVEKKRKIKYSRRKKYKKNAEKLFNMLKEFSCKIILIIILILILIFLSELKFTNISSTKVGLCVSIKEENLYIKEFIEHYKNLGYNHIFIYDNNDIDGEKLEDVIQKEINKGFISIINYRGNNKKPQMEIFRDCYEKNNKNYDWLSFFDVDEFLEIKPKGIKIQEFLDNKRYNNCENIKINWLLYSDDEKLYYENKPVQERFKTALYNNSKNTFVKIIVRGNLPTNFWEVAPDPHSGANNYTICILSGKNISKEAYHISPNYEYGYLKHYMTKTIEEYIKKIEKGRINCKWRGVRSMINYFFDTNKKTKEKIDIFKKKFKINIY